MSNLSDEQLHDLIDDPIGISFDDVEEMARELLTLREVNAILQEQRDYLANQLPKYDERLAAAEQVLREARSILKAKAGCHLVTGDWRNLRLAVEAYDKVVAETQPSSGT